MAHIVDDALRQELDQLVANMCRGLNDPKRLMVLYALSNEPLTVSELGSILGTPQSNTSQHLAVLRSAGMVETERRGNHVVYSLRHPKVVEAIDLLRSAMADELAQRRDLLAG
jgi:ArsR family transcriptional regulator